jgi:hypothetical protein
VFVSPATETSRSHIYYLSDDLEDRRHMLEKSAGPSSLTDLGVIRARLVHLVGVRVEFPLDFMRDLKANDSFLSGYAGVGAAADPGRW